MNPLRGAPPRDQGQRTKDRMGERLDSNQQPEAYEAPALPLSHAPDSTANTIRAAGRHRTGDRSLTRRLLCQLSYHGFRQDSRSPICNLRLGETGIAGTLRPFNRKSQIGIRKSKSAAGGLRTHDIRFGRPALCRLSYRYVKCAGRGSNPGPPPWQSGVLATELPTRFGPLSLVICPLLELCRTSNK